MIDPPVESDPPADATATVVSVPEPSSDGRRERRVSDLSVLARGGMFSLAGSIASSILGFVLVVVVTRALRAGGSGLFFEAVAVFTILASITELGADTGLVRMVARYITLDRTRDLRTMLRIALWPVAIAGVVCGLVMLIFATPVADVFIRHANRQEGLVYLKLLAPFVPLFAYMTVALAATRGFGTLRPYVWIGNVGVPFARPVLVLFVIVAGLGAAGVALAYGIPVAVGCAITLVALFRLLRRAERLGADTALPPRPTREVSSEFWRFAAPRGLAGFLMTAMAWVDVLMVGALRSTSQAGIYTAAARFIGVGTFALQAVGMAIAPQVSALLSTNDRARAQDVFQTATWWLMAPSWPMYLAMATFAPLLMSIFGPQFVGGQNALMILSLGLMLLVGTGNNKIVLLMGGKSSLNLVTTVAAVVVNIALNFALIPRWGIEGASVAIVATLAVDNGLTTYFVWRYLGLLPFGRGYPIIAVGSFVLYGGLGLAFRAIFGAGVVSFLAYGALATALYGALLWRFRGALHLAVLRDSFKHRVAGADAPVAPGWTGGGGGS